MTNFVWVRLRKLVWWAVLGVMVGTGPAVRAAEGAAEPSAAGNIPKAQPLQLTDVPRYRYLFILESSAAMQRLSDKAAQVVSDLILSGFNDRVQPNDLIGLWLVGQNLTNTPFSMFQLDSSNRVETSTQVFRFISDLKTKEKAVDLRAAFFTLSDFKAKCPKLTVFLISSGNDPVMGTAFDGPINAVFAGHAKGLQKKETPFVTVITSEGRRWVRHAVTPGNQRPFIPPFPDQLRTAAPAAAAPAPPPPRIGQPLIMRGTNVLRTVPEEELQEVLRKSDAQPVADPAPPNPP